MTNAERFLEAFAHVRHRVMGRWVEPFTLRHRFWLEAFESPLVTGGTATLLDLELAARLCAIPFRKLDSEVPRMLGRGPRVWERWGFALRAWRKGSKAWEEYEKFQDYLGDHGCPPAVHGGGGKGKRRYEAMPGILGLVTALVRGSGWGPEEVWGLSPGAAEWYLTGIFMHRGVDMRIKTAHDEEFEAGLMAERAAAAARRAEVPSIEKVPSAKPAIAGSSKLEVPSSKEQPEELEPWEPPLGC